ncbi:unnamed protein product, partial [Musa textilis]
MMGANFCFMRGFDEDSLSHLFLGCSFSHAVYYIIKQRLDISFRLYDLWQTGPWLRKGDELGKQSCLTLRAIIAYAFWMIWKARNDVVFNGKTTTSYSIFCKVVACVAVDPVQSPPEGPP